MSKEDCQCELDQEQLDKLNILKQSIFDKTVTYTKITPEIKVDKEMEKEKQLKEEKTKQKETKEKKVKAPVAQCSNLNPLNLDDMEVEKVLVEYKVRKSQQKPPKGQTKPVEMENTAYPMADCDAFRMAGFQPDWTKEKIEGMLKSEDGRMILSKVDQEFKKLTGKKMISEKDILKCYPNYLKRSKKIQLSIELNE